MILIDTASARGYAAALNLQRSAMMQHGLKRSAEVGDIIVINGNTNDPWYSFAAIDNASANGNVDALEWWKSSGLELKWSLAATSRDGHVKVFDWCHSNGLAWRFNLLFNVASRDGRGDILYWWKNS
ncbi:putative ankyrin repeat protein [Cladochytrium replicatum]|nr:putative ankyrin repeat protein [Cladochytrium replicatum]